MYYRETAPFEIQPVSIFIKLAKIFVQKFIYAMSQSWKINAVGVSLQYAKDREARKIALTISLANGMQWYYLVREQERVPDRS